MVTKSELENLAILSKLDIPEEKMETLLKDMEEIIAFADTVNSATSEGVEFDNINGLENVFREDEIVESYSSDEILKNTKAKENGHFFLSKRG